MKELISRLDWGWVVISLIFVVIVLYMLPLHEQTFGDDWAYKQSVEYFVRTGQLKVSDWSSASLIFQIYWGVLFSKIFGFSLKILDLSSMSILYLGLVSFYLLLKRLNLSRIRAMIFTLVLLSFPWILLMGLSFYTNVMAMSLCITAIYFYIRGLQDGKIVHFIIGSVVISCAILTRQDSVVVLLALPLVLWLKWPKRQILAKVVVSSFLIPTLILVGYYLWLSKPGNITAAQFKTTFISANEQLWQQYLPIIEGQIKTTNLYYSKYLQRVIFYAFHLIGFLLPVFLIFRIDFRKFIRFAKDKGWVVIFSYLIFLFIFGVEFVFRYGNSRYEIDPPSLIFIYSNLFPSYQVWLKVWNWVIFISVLIWVPIFGVSIVNFFNSWFKYGYRFPVKKVIITRLVLTAGCLLFIDYIRIFIKNFMGKNSLGEYLHYSWLVPVMIFLIIGSVAYFISRYRIQKITNERDQIYLFLILIFGLEMMFLIFMMLYQWPQYLPSLIPLVVVWLSQVTKNWQLDIFRVATVLVFLLIFSASLTKNRYQTNGIIFELSNNLIKEGVEPVTIDAGSPGLAWLPWWYYESTLKTASKNAGSKYKIESIGTWNVMQDYIPSYRVVAIKGDDNVDNQKGVIIYDSGVIRQDYFKKARYLIILQQLDDSQIAANKLLNVDQFFIYPKAN